MEPLESLPPILKVESEKKRHGRIGECTLKIIRGRKKCRGKKKKNSGHDEHNNQLQSSKMIEKI